MVKTGCRTLALILLLCAHAFAQCITPEGLEADVQRDMEDLPLVSEPDSDAIIQKYILAKDRIHPSLQYLVRTKGCKAENELLLAGILRMDVDWNPPGEGCPSEEQKSLAAFYAFRISPSESNKQALACRIERLRTMACDGVEILFLPFLDDVDESLRLYALLREGSDGAMAEMLAWAVAYLAYTHQADGAVFQHIEEAAGKYHDAGWDWAGIR